MKIFNCIGPCTYTYVIRHLVDHWEKNRPVADEQYESLGYRLIGSSARWYSWHPNFYLCILCVSLSSVLKNRPSPASFSFIFGLFKQTTQFLQQIKVKNVMSIQLMAQGFKPTTSEHESSPITTRTRAPKSLRWFHLQNEPTLKSYEDSSLVVDDLVHSLFKHSQDGSIEMEIYLPKSLGQ